MVAAKDQALTVDPDEVKKGVGFIVAQSIDDEYRIGFGIGIHLWDQFISKPLV